MKNYLLATLSISFLFSTGCQEQEYSLQEDESFSSESFVNSLETNLQEAFILLDSGYSTSPFLQQVQDDNLGNVTCNTPLSRNALKSHRTVIKTYDGESNSGISIPGFGGLTLGKKESSLHVYYVEPTVVECEGKETVYGIGYSMHLLVKKMKKGLDLSKLPLIAASVQLNNNKTSVLYSMQTHGVSGIPIVKFFKPTVDKPFDVEGYGLMQSSIDGIHGVLGDSILSSRVRFSPEELSFISPEDLKK